MKQFSYLLVIIFLCLSCQNDDEYINIEQYNSSILDKSKKYFESKKTTFKVAKSNDNISDNVSWEDPDFISENATFHDVNNFTVAFPIRNQNSIVIERLLMKSINGEIKGRVISFLFDKKDIKANKSDIEKFRTHDILKNYEVSIFVLDLETFEESDNIDFDSSNFSIYSASGSSYCSVCHNNWNWIEPVEIVGGYDPWIDPFPIGDYPTYPIGGWNPGNNNNNNNLGNYIDPSFQNNDCLWSVYQQMGTTSTFNNYLKNFDSQFSSADITWSASSNLASNVNAHVTEPFNSNQMTIMFNLNNLNRPSLDVARTMMHELIHAEIYRKMLSCSELPYVNFNNYSTEQWRNFINNLQGNFPGIFDYYVRYQYNSSTPTDWQHQMMAQHYRDIIKDALREYDNNSSSEDVYDALSWEGLGDTWVWNNLSSQQKNNINQTLANFRANNSNCQ